MILKTVLNMLSFTTVHDDYIKYACYRQQIALDFAHCNIIDCETKKRGTNTSPRLLSKLLQTRTYKLHQHQEQTSSLI